MVIIGVALNILLNFVWRKDNFQLITSAIVVVVFVGITAYNTKIMNEFNKKYEPQKAVIIGVFALSLNLYYLFIAIVFEANKGTSRING